ncbi:hypothetical protein EV401DRAFT_2213553 [Pisolithus croceorrhizus]|nr:hypothetical protein EV401DRAFT_2213553 [Pisolithus croceorrhizus]
MLLRRCKSKLPQLRLRPLRIRQRCSIIRLIVPPPPHPSSTSPSTAHDGSAASSTTPTQTTWVSQAGSDVPSSLYGITLLQTYVYYMHYSGDALIVKFLVAATCILDTLHVSFVCHMLYHYLITNYGVPTSLEYIVWSWQASLIVNLLTILAVQFFFVHKIHYHCPHKVRWLVTAPILLLVVAHFASGIGPCLSFQRGILTVMREAVAIVVTFIDTNTSVLAQTWYYSAISSAATVTVAEILITVSLCVLLYNGGSHAALPRTKRLVNTIIVYAANRCLLTVLVVVGELAADVDQQASWSMGLNFVLGTLYTNSLLASLNSREYLLSQGSTAMSAPSVSVLHFAVPPVVLDNVGSSKDGGR